LIGSLGLTLFFFWSAASHGDVPLWLAVIGGFGSVTTLVEAVAEIKNRRAAATRPDTEARGEV
jgi:hypothetical protein